MQIINAKTYPITFKMNEYFIHFSRYGTDVVFLGQALWPLYRLENNRDESINDTPIIKCKQKKKSTIYEK